MRLQAIFFDIGDTLVFDDPPLRERFGIALQQAYIPYSPRRLPEAFQVGEATALECYLRGLPWDDPVVMQQSAEQVIEALGLPPLSPSQWQAVRSAFDRVPFVRRVHPHAHTLLRELQRRGFVLGAISDWNHTLPNLLEEWELASFFHARSVSALVGVTKPNARLFQNALLQAQTPPKASLHVGDWYALDVVGARAAGMNALLFDHAGRTPDADCPRVQTFEEMQEYLLALPSTVG